MPINSTKPKSRSKNQKSNDDDVEAVEGGEDEAAGRNSSQYRDTPMVISSKSQHTAYSATVCYKFDMIGTTKNNKTAKARDHHLSCTAYVNGISSSVPLLMDSRKKKVLEWDLVAADPSKSAKYHDEKLEDDEQFMMAFSKLIGEDPVLKDRIEEGGDSSSVDEDDEFGFGQIYNDAVEESDDEDAKDGNETPQQAARGRRKSKRKETPVVPLPCVAKAGLTPGVGKSIDKPTEEFKTRCDECLGVYIGNKFKNNGERERRQRHFCKRKGTTWYCYGCRRPLCMEPPMHGTDRKGNKYPKFFSIQVPTKSKVGKVIMKEERGDLTCYILAHKKLMSEEALKAAMKAGPQKPASTTVSDQKPAATVSDKKAPRKSAAVVSDKKAPRKSAASASNGDHSDEGSDDEEASKKKLKTKKKPPTKAAAASSESNTTRAGDGNGKPPCYQGYPISQKKGIDIHRNYINTSRK